MKRKLKELISIQISKNPGRMVLAAILLFNLAFVAVSALIISKLSLTGTEHMGFLESAFYTITMILDAGCISFVISDIGTSGVLVAVICLLIIVIGMVGFTGAVIGYVTNYISDFIGSANAGSNKLRISNHLVILNWNTRASEIINDLLFCSGKQRVVVMSDKRPEEIRREVNERLADTIRKENRRLGIECHKLSFFRGHLRYDREHLRNNIDLIVRQGDVFSSKQLMDISLHLARSVVILGNDINGSECAYENREKQNRSEQGNPLTVKTLMQVSDITSAYYSADNQKIIVEITDDWTWELVNRIIRYKQANGVSGKCNIVPIRVNQILGQILAQFSIMPELNLAYQELFSNKGATFYVEERKECSETEYISNYLDTHDSALPLTAMQDDGRSYFFYAAESQKSIEKLRELRNSGYRVELNRNYWIEQKNVVILGHNSKSRDIMQGFSSFGEEWNYKDGREILNIVVIDDRQNLEKMDYYREYPFVIDTVPASVYDREEICKAIEAFVDSNTEDTSVLILSDDSVPEDEQDANALANLVLIQDIISARKQADPDFDTESIDVIVEIINPKHHDIVSSYSVDNVVISNRYISKMITQIGEKEAIFTFYSDILTYDESGTNKYESKEVYTKKVSSFFARVPEECTQKELVNAVWRASIDQSVPEDKRYPTVVLGYVKPGGEVVLFGEEQSQRRVKLERNDKIIVFTNH